MRRVSKAKRDEYLSNDLTATARMMAGDYGSNVQFRMRLTGTHCVRQALIDALDEPRQDLGQPYHVAPHV